MHSELFTMAVSFSDTSVHTQDSYFRNKSNLNRGDPTDLSLNPPQLLRDYPVKERWLTQGDSKDFNQMSAILKAYPNVRYMGMTQEASNKILFADQEFLRISEELNKNEFFSKPEDGEKENRIADISAQTKNPEFILSKKNDADIDKKLEDRNSIQKRWDIDGGSAVFDYSPEDATQVKMVQDANVNYMQRRDRFFTSPQGSGGQATAENQVDIIKQLEKEAMQFESMMSSVPQRNKAGR